MKKKGQAALEFLMTYGWAILAAVIVIGVLYFLIGNPSNLAGDKFIMAAPLVANAMVLSDANGVTIDITNGAGKTVTVTGVTITGCTGTTTYLLPTPGALPIAVGVSANQQFKVACAAADLVANSRLNADVTISYTTSTGGLTQTASGTINGKIGA